MRDDLPNCTVTFLFTDVEGPTKLLHSLGAEAYAESLAEHRRVIREACAAEGGSRSTRRETRSSSRSRRRLALLLQRPRSPSRWPPPDPRPRRPPHWNAARHQGGLRRRRRASCRPHRRCRPRRAGARRRLDGHARRSRRAGRPRRARLLKDLATAERVYHLGDGEFPPLKSLYRSNLPLTATRLIGRKKELADVLQALSWRTSRSSSPSWGEKPSPDRSSSRRSTGRDATLPNDSTGWLPRGALGGSVVDNTHLVVDLDGLEATLFRGERILFRAPVGVGQPA